MQEGFRNEALRAALTSAVSGDRGALEALLTRYGNLPSPLPNLKLAAAFGAEIALLPHAPVRLLRALDEENCPAESPRAFLPVAAAYGWAALIGAERELDAAWNALADFTADSRRPIRLGVTHALRELASREGAADTLVERGFSWLELEEPDTRFSACATALEVLADSHVLGSVQNPQRLVEYVSQTIDALSDASRATSRLAGWRRLLTSLTAVSAAIVRQLRAADLGADWLAAECERAKQPDLRAALSDALLALGKSNVARGTVDRLRKSLEGSAKPVRDAARVRPGSGRGRKSRSIR